MKKKLKNRDIAAYLDRVLPKVTIQVNPVTLEDFNKFNKRVMGRAGRFFYPKKIKSAVDKELMT